MKKKQGAYGKIPTHSDSTFIQLLHVNEVYAAWKLLYWSPLNSNLDELLLDGNNEKGADGDGEGNEGGGNEGKEGEAPAGGGEEDAQKKKQSKMEDLSFCNTILTSVSRSFAAVIRQLPLIVLVDVMIFYLVLRALDTIEDDMTFFHKTMMKGEGDATDSSEDITTTTTTTTTANNHHINNNNNNANQAKVSALLSFHKTALTNPDWKLMGCGDGDERRLLEHFPQCHSIFLSLPSESRRIIVDITQRMACGMAEFVTKDLGQGTTDILEYNRYCHFVAGLWIGITKLHLSDQMGLFLQKTNIIRDYLEDYVDGRAFWPMEIWNKYSPNGDLGYFANPTTEEAKNAGLACLDELITDAFELVPDCLAYLSKLQCVEIFRFCAIPQVMAIATLEKCYHNPNVFTGVVKIRKGTSCLLINSAVDLRGVHDIFHWFAMRIMSKAEGFAAAAATEEEV
ncbi:hypothetical protein ACHAWU_001338 [Discostella pseudostelligera]|uniref:Squalene synthase n=1 Tax=Discostella pseudostelligera TaxID=259834 RepID=A0ABD3M5W4_9STRA